MHNLKHRQDKKVVNQDLIYGTIHNSMVFAPTQVAQNQADIRFAIQRAKTWQDFIDLTSQDTFDNIILEILEYLDYGQLYGQYLMGEDLSTYISDLHLPQPDDDFTTDVLPEFDEGNYFPRLAQEMLALIPTQLVDEMGEVRYDHNDDFFYYLNPENESLIIKSLEVYGYVCTKNQALIEQAEGIDNL